MSFSFQPHHTALRSLFLIAQHHHAQLLPEHFAKFDQGNTLGSIVRLIGDMGLHGKAQLKCKWSHLVSLGSAYPVLIVRNDGHWQIVEGVVGAAGEAQAVQVVDPRDEQAGTVLVSKANFMADWSGTLVLCGRVRSEMDISGPFGIRWFLPEIFKHRRYLRDVAIAAIMANIIGFATPLLMQVVIDKVIPHSSYQTLFMIVLLFAVTIVFNAVFGYVRQNLMLYVSNKIDGQLASRTFEHLLSLPLPFFEGIPAGVLGRNMQQTERVRQFLTGRLFQTLLDATALPVLLFVLILYSAKLTAVVLLFSLLITACIGFILPTFRRHLEHLYSAEGMRQAHLIETIHGVRTLKTLAMEKDRKAEWDAKVATSVERHAIVGRISALTGTLTHALEQTMTITVLALGAESVFSGNLSLGSLVAFNMLSNRVTGPLVQIIGLINEYQETALSVKMLGTVMNHPPERASDQRGLQPVITGSMDFDQVRFRYPGAPRPALDNITFKVEEGLIYGVVGRSGSGKSTMTRIIQGIYPAQEGLVRLNGIDIRHIDLRHLRRSIGVVLQDNFLFRGTIRENIIASAPGADLTQVIAACQLAGADEFIDRLPQAYDTMVEEGATNFSGGQRQRLGIARALISQPKLLIFDEATSALDPDSEAIIQGNLKKIAEGRTMIIISHRLSSLVEADAIMVLEQGEMIDFAPHHVLLERCEIYSHLWNQQNRHLSS